MLIAHQQVVSALSSGLKSVVDLQPCTLKESHTSGFLLVLVSKLRNSKSCGKHNVHAGDNLHSQQELETCRLNLVLIYQFSAGKMCSCSK